MRKTLGVLVGVLAVLVVSGCFGTPGENTAEARTEVQKQVAIPVEVLEPRRGAISNYFETTSRVEAERRVQITSEAVGKCTKVCAEEGDRVKQGDVLAELDKEEVNAQVRSASAQLQKLKTDNDRAKQLFAEGLSAKAEYDTARYAYEQQSASLNQLQIQLSNKTIRAPIGGIVTKKNVQVGQLVSTGSPVFEVVDPGSYMLAINPPEKLLPNLRVGQVAKVAIDSVQDSEFEAKVTRINPAVDSQTGTVKVTLAFDEGTIAKLRESAFARVRLVMETRPDALLVPKDAVVEENTRKYLFVVENKAPAPAGGQSEETAGAASTQEPILVANRIEVQTGLEDRDQMEIVTGLSDGAKVVTLGQQTLKPGSEVKITSVENELAANTNLSARDALQQAEARRQEKAAGAN